VPTCAVCGNDYDKAFEVVVGGKRSWFDSFECAIHMLAPRCAECGMAVIGHGAERGGVIFCCEHCMRQHGGEERREHA